MLESLSKRILICTFFAALPLFYLSAIDKTMRPAKEDQDWRMLQQAENYFEDEKYGEAINLAEKAKDSRKQEVAWERYTIESSFKNSTVRKAGDSLSEVIDALKKRSSVSALNVISSAFDKKGESYFGNSVSKLNEYLSTADRYPEADYLIGKIYNLEGETELSLQYLQKALLNQDALDVPEQKYDIMYTLAEISYNSGNDDDYEKYLKLVLKDDANYKDPDNPNAPGTLMNAMIATIKNKRNPGTSYNDKEKTVDKFFKLYRSRNVISIKACLERLSVLSNAHMSVEHRSRRRCFYKNCNDKDNRQYDRKRHEYKEKVKQPFERKVSLFSKIVRAGESHDAAEITHMKRHRACKLFLRN